MDDGEFCGPSSIRCQFSDRVVAADPRGADMIGNTISRLKMDSATCF